MTTPATLLELAESHAMYARRCLNEHHIKGWGNVARAEAATATAFCDIAALKLKMEDRDA